MSKDHPAILVYVCRDCGETKPASEFYQSFRPKTPGGKSRCKPCELARLAKRREQQLAEDPEGYRMQKRASVARHRERHPDRVTLGTFVHNEAHRRLREAHRDEYLRYRELVRDELRQWSRAL